VCEKEGTTQWVGLCLCSICGHFGYDDSHIARHVLRALQIQDILSLFHHLTNLGNGLVFTRYMDKCEYPFFMMTEIKIGRRLEIYNSSDSSDSKSDSMNCSSSCIS
jgi:hypothetical protein